jgi:hypothetical protein
MESIPRQGNEEPTRVGQSRPRPDAETVVLTVLATVLLAVLFLLVTSGSAAP